MSDDFKISEIQASFALSQDRRYVRIAEAGLSALNSRDLQAIRPNLHPDLQFVGPEGEVHDRASFLETYQKVFGHLEKVEDITAEALSNNLVYFTYYMVLPAPAGPIRTTMKMTHDEEGLIKKIEMAYDAARLKSYLDSKK